jgi:hypothetical protein
MKKWISRIFGANRVRRAVRVVYFSFFIGMYMTAPAYAYIDPATTAMLTQIVAGIFISLGVVFGVFRQKIILFFKNLHVKSMQRKIAKSRDGRNGGGGVYK